MNFSSSDLDEAACSPGVTRVSFQEESDEDLVGLLDEADRKRRGGGGGPRSNGRAAGRKRDEDDSDEDLLRV